MVKWWACTNMKGSRCITNTYTSLLGWNTSRWSLRAGSVIWLAATMGLALGRWESGCLHTLGLKVNRGQLQVKQVMGKKDFASPLRLIRLALSNRPTLNKATSQKSQKTEVLARI